MVPRASIGFTMHNHEGTIAAAGFVTLIAPLERSQRMRGSYGHGAPRRMRLVGAPIACRVPEACRWEGRARAGTLAELAEDEALEGRGTP